VFSTSDSRVFGLVKYQKREIYGRAEQKVHSVKRKKISGYTQIPSNNKLVLNVMGPTINPEEPFISTFSTNPEITVAVYR